MLLKKVANVCYLRMYCSTERFFEGTKLTIKIDVNITPSGIRSNSGPNIQNIGAITNDEIKNTILKIDNTKQMIGTVTPTLRSLKTNTDSKPIIMAIGRAKNKKSKTYLKLLK